ncbi:unnamed protein product [Rotaria magnacalcarata]|uniref:G-protein coupled receptors family 1 profile domain-containing protein n=2 Tax=Rotaria magnacalcarata TaxID=392030 RepID=A0A8S3ERY9_9BILA|nr:unnamed protein product [Rotaria magnacalcarata]
MTIELFFNAIILALSSISFLISIFILIAIFIYIRPLLSNMAILLTCNSYISLVLGTLMMIIIYSYSIYYSLKSSDFYNDFLCPLRGYFLHVFICAFFYSCLLQAIFRLFRVAFYKLNSRKSHYLFLIGIFLTWFIAFLYILLHLLKHDFEYTSLAYGCWISFANVYGLFQALLVMYVGPNSTVCLIYAYIVRYSRRKTHIQPHQQKLNSRDLIILKRIVIIVLVAMGIGIATLITFLVYIITNYLVPTAYHLQGLSISGGFFMGSVGFAFITPQIKDIFLMKKQRIAPVIAVDVIL